MKLSASLALLSWIAVSALSAAPTETITVQTGALTWDFVVWKGVLSQRAFGLKSAPDKTDAPAVFAFPQYLDSGRDVTLEPTLDILGADGVRNTFLTFDSKDVTTPAPGRTLTTVRLKDVVTGAGLDLHFLAYDRENIIEAWSVVHNGGKSPVTLLRYDSFALSLTGKDLHLTTFKGNWGDEANWSESPVTTGLRRIGNLQFTHPTHGYVSGFVLSDGKAREDEGRVVAGSLAWSGNWHLDFQRETVDGVRVAGGLSPLQPQVLAPGASLETPKIILTVSDRGKNGASQNFDRWARCYGMRHADVVRPVILNSWDGARFSFDEKRLLSMMDGAAKAGVEMFVLDDGWFGNGEYARNNDKAGLGDWQTNTGKLPHDIQWLADRAKARGLAFGLWVEPEMINPKSELFQKHPDWAVKLPGRDHRLGRNQIPLDLSKTEVEAFAYRAVADLLDKYPGISYIKWDNNGHLRDPGSQGAAPEAQMAMTTAMTRAYYRILDRLIAKYPDVLFQDCASGGGRAEYGALSRHAEFWASDNQNPLKRLKMHWSYSHFFPAMATAAHIAETFDSKKYPIKFRTDVAMTARLGVELDPTHLKLEALDTMAKGIAEYKRLRSVLHNGLLRRGLSPFASDITTSSHVLDDRSKAVFFAFRTGDFDKPGESALVVPGLDPAKRYRVAEANAGTAPHVTGATFSGKELLERGLPVRWSTGYESAVVELTAE